jgi:hypothetical protein
MESYKLIPLFIRNLVICDDLARLQFKTKHVIVLNHDCIIIEIALLFYKFQLKGFN